MFIRRQAFFCNKSHTHHTPHGVSSSNSTGTALSTKRSKVLLQGYKWKDLPWSLAFFTLMDEFTATSREESPALHGKHACIILLSGSLFSQLGRDFLSWQWPLLPGSSVQDRVLYDLKRRGCLGSAPTLVQRQTPFCYFLNEQSGCNQPVCQLSIKKCSGQNSLKKQNSSPVRASRNEVSSILHLQCRNVTFFFLISDQP